MGRQVEHVAFLDDALLDAFAQRPAAPGRAAPARRQWRRRASPRVAAAGVGLALVVAFAGVVAGLFARPRLAAWTAALVAPGAGVRPMPGTVLFEDRFERNDLGAWHVVDGFWTVDAGALEARVPTAFSRATITAGTLAWTDYRLEVTVRWLAGGDEEIGFRHSAGGQYVVGLHHADGVTDLRFGISYRGWLRVVPVDLPRDTPHRLRIDVVGSRVTVSLAGQQLIDYVDAEQAATAGDISLGLWSGAGSASRARFSDVRVIALAPISQAARPGGVWIGPANGERVSGPVRLAARAYPRNPSDPPIAAVNFTVSWAGQSGSWLVACRLTQPIVSDRYECLWDPAAAGAPPGPLQLSFDVEDASLPANVNLAPNGTRTIILDPAGGSPSPGAGQAQVAARCLNGEAAAPVAELCVRVEYTDVASTHIRIDAVESCVAPRGPFAWSLVIVEPHVWDEGRFVNAWRSMPLRFAVTQGTTGPRCDRVTPSLLVRKGQSNGVWTTAWGLQCADEQAACGRTGPPLAADAAPTGDAVRLDRVWVGFDQLR